jgi:hypothetical protein
MDASWLNEPCPVAGAHSHRDADRFRPSPKSMTVSARSASVAWFARIPPRGLLGRVQDAYLVGVDFNVANDLCHPSQVSVENIAWEMASSSFVRGHIAQLGSLMSVVKISDGSHKLTL